MHWCISAHSVLLISEGNDTCIHRTITTTAGAAGVDLGNRQHVNKKVVGKPQSVKPWKRNVVMSKFSLQSEAAF